MDKYLIFFLNIFIIALPMAFFEILIEKDKGWGSGWSVEKWYARAFAPGSVPIKLLLKIIRTESPLNYHIVFFVGVLPLIFIAEYFFVTHNILLLFASFIAVALLEDFFWFLCNWNFDSLNQLFKGPKGSIWWHKSWIKVARSSYLPASYFTAAPAAIILLLLA